MKFKMFSLLLVICFVVAGAESNHVKEKYELAFAMAGEPLGPEATLELLKSIDDLITNDSLGRKLKKEQPKIRELIEVANVNPDKCNLDNVALIGNLYDHNIEFSTNIVPYLEHYRLKQFKACKETFASEMTKAVNDLPLEAQTAGKLLRDTFLEANKGSDDKMRYLRVEESALKEALVLYMGRQPFEFIDKKKVSGAKGDEIFKRIFEHTVTRMCNKITEGLDSQYKLYNHLLGESKIAKRVDDETLGWITVYRICTFHSDHPKFYTELRTVFRKKNDKFWGDLKKL